MLLVSERPNFNLIATGVVNYLNMCHSQNLKSGSRDPDHAPLGVIHHILDSTRCGIANKEKKRSV